MLNSSKIVILATDSRSTRLVYNGLSQSMIIDKVIIEDKVPTKQFLKYRLKKLGFWAVFGQLLFQVLIMTPLSKLSKKRVTQILNDTNNSIKDIPEEKIVRVRSVNDDSTRLLLHSLTPSVVVVNGTRIIGKKTLSCINVPFINTHVGITPLYRGVHGGYWALTENRTDACGVTVHQVDTGVDTGAILGQALINPTTEDNFTTYPILQTVAAIDLLKKIIPFAINGNLSPIEPIAQGQSKQWFHPTILEYLRFFITKRVR